MQKDYKIEKKRKQFYWILVGIIFLLLLFMVRYVLDSSKVIIDKSLVIRPFKVHWSPNSDGLLRINEPFYLNTNAKFIVVDLNKLATDEEIYNSLILRSQTNSSLRDISPPFTIWKHENNDTIHIMKNNLVLDFIME
ncbi:MAG: hypothetical protein RBT46_07635 [Weeksellaceae bacterium]|nr:hypothetical protein [Weeksellaceae bacterium]MDX9705562.1 hypothetical protein [Weeksellaceae bacterium]